MEIASSVALVTGANRGLGRAFAQALVERGAQKVYATARRPESVDLAGVEVLPLDVTDPASVAAAAQAAPDVTLLVNNAGISTGQSLLTGDLAEIRREMEVHYFGTLNVTRAFAPGLRGVVNVLSALSWFAAPGATSYAAAKSAQWGLTNALRLELPQALVTGVHLGVADTDMAEKIEGFPKLAPADLARIVLDGVERDEIEILADDWSALVKKALQEPGVFTMS
ncbi:SDR family oxidoreductase [Pseudonocardia sp. WMMC193]|uniref:SDR family oxidoreductase n=1 Tax=Pseudonocardia sp. WMMC193 TaxID=2911965 RepID=UPI001F49163E|nr:SDR family oxidoreductase [Pseudonocardia sp. WMMC193]MCF7552549.1 SDR family oxidoreductase [Pseudonocardia sp. WMMC193]